MTTTQECRACATHFPYSEDADYCPTCAAENAGYGDTYYAVDADLFPIRAYLTVTKEEGEKAARGEWVTTGDVDYAFKVILDRRRHEPFDPMPRTIRK